ncbi:MAG: hypothetical protein ACRDNS_02815 [Trebonia sp.]
MAASAHETSAIAMILALLLVTTIFTPSPRHPASRATRPARPPTS